MNLTQHCDSLQTYQNQMFHSLWTPFSSSLLLYFIRIIASHDELRTTVSYGCIHYAHAVRIGHYDVTSGVI